MFTGTLTYNNKNFIFILDENIKELQLIPLTEEKTVMNGINFINSSASVMQEPYLIGIINENHKKMIAITELQSPIRSVNNVLYVILFAYIIIDSDDSKKINKMTFCSPEINRIFNVNKAFYLPYEDIMEFHEKGTITIKTNDFDSTTSEKQSFKVNDTEVYVRFEITRKISTVIGNPPLSLNSCLCFNFEATDDYSFIIDLWRYAKSFIRYLCFRRNIYFSSIELYSPDSQDKHSKIGTLYVFSDHQEPEQEPNKSGRCIKYEYISGNEGKILPDIAENNLYLRHLPKTYEDSKHIDIASFIMTTAAFEWEFKRNYPNGIVKNPSTIKAEDTVSKQIQQLLDKSTGKAKDKYKFLLRLVKSDSLLSEIIQISKDYSEIIDIFGNHLYKMNHSELKYNEMAKRISDQRNHFAHGDLDKEFISNSLTDVIFLRYIIYALQLKSYSLSDENIKKSINDLFHFNLALR